METLQLKSNSERSGPADTRQAYSTRERRLTLHAVRETLSDGTLNGPNWKGLLYFFRDWIAFGVIFYGIWKLDEWYFLLPLWILAGFSISSLFIIGHDAAHGSLFTNKRLSWWVGQLAMLPSLHAYQQWSYGHNRVHHGHTIKVEGDFVWRPLTPATYEKLSLVQKLNHRFQWSVFGGGFYYMTEIWLKGMILYTAPIEGTKRDKWIVISFALIVSGLSFYFGGIQGSHFEWTSGIWYWVKMIGLPFVAWNYCIGIAVYVHHIHDTIPWKRHKDWTPFYGQMMGTVNYHIPAPINFFFHNIFIHMPHHVNMRIPFYNLRKALEEIRTVYADYVIERKSMFMDYIKATKQCKLFDPETGKWLNYQGANQRSQVAADLV